MELIESLWLAVVAVPIGIFFTWPAWLVGRIGGFIHHGVSQRLPFTRTSLSRWMGFFLSSTVTVMLIIALKTTEMAWLLALVAIAAAASQFFAFMIGVGARDWKTIAAEPDRSHLAERPLDEMDNELIDILDQGTAA